MALGYTQINITDLSMGASIYWQIVLIILLCMFAWHGNFLIIIIFLQLNPIEIT